jgi:hypothetical protein
MEDTLEGIKQEKAERIHYSIHCLLSFHSRVKSSVWVGYTVSTLMIFNLIVQSS